MGSAAYQPALIPVEQALLAGCNDRVRGQLLGGKHMFSFFTIFVLAIMLTQPQEPLDLQ